MKLRKIPQDMIIKAVDAVVRQIPATKLDVV